MGARELQEQAAALFLLAEDAFGRGKTQLGEQLTDLALRYLDEADALETALTQPPPESQRPVIQQQQQVQPKDDDKE
jgi:hypothetical protein